MVQTMIDEVPTFGGWIAYVKGVPFMGAYGAVGGLGFWLVWRAHFVRQTGRHARAND
jgi:hypothetical protein